MVSGRLLPRNGLDRIVSLEETERTFKMPRGFDVDALFSESFGVFFPKEGEKSVTIRFKAPEGEARYLRDLPLHHTQVEEGKDVRIELEITPRKG